MTHTAKMSDGEGAPRPGLVKVIFELQQDEDGYPPQNRESMWARTVGGDVYELDNIPFFAGGVSLKDQVRAETEANQLHFKEVVRPSGHSTIRVVLFDVEGVAELRSRLRDLGCPSEQTHIPGLIAVDVPPEVRIKVVRELLDEGERTETWEYEEGCIRQ